MFLLLFLLLSAGMLGYLLFLTPWISPVFWYLAAVNLIAFVLYGRDKSLAQRKGAGRISERTLLLSALLGGTCGALAAETLFRHKVSKTAFQGPLYAIAILQLALFTGYLVLRGVIPMPDLSMLTARFH